MGSVYNRGTRAKPKWYVSYKDAEGERKTVPSKQPAKSLARSFVEEIEARIADGKVGIKQPTDEPLIQSRMEDWIKGLTNRNAADDRSRVKKHVLPSLDHAGSRKSDCRLS